MDEGNKPMCHVCDGTDYYVSAGFYYCEECHTQALDVCESYLDIQDNTINMIVKKKVVRTPTTGPKQKKEVIDIPENELRWTSWEGHNFILKGLVDELISMGACPEVKLIALQLWAKYLGKLEVAFTSTTEQLLPKFGINQTAKDYLAIYGHVKKKRKRLKKLLKKPPARSLARLAEDTTLTDKRRLSISKKLLVDVEYGKIKEELASSKDVMSQIDERLKLIQAVCQEHKDSFELDPKVVQYNKSAEKVLKNLKKKIDEREEFEEESLKRGDACYAKFSSCFDAMFLTRQKVLALLALALLISKEDIQMSDLLRWIKEGHVSYSKATHLFPTGVKFRECDIVFMKGLDVRHKSLEYCVLNIANLLEVEKFPTPDFLALARRYILELQLPSGLGDYVERLMDLCHLDQCEGFMSYGAVVMAFIVVVLKTLLGLDGQTEHHISELAKEINHLIDNDETSSLKTKLFVWDDWVRYIECRKAVIMNEHFPTKHQFEQDLSTSANPYVQFWCKHEDKDPNIEEKRECRVSRVLAHRQRIAVMRQTVEQLPNPTPDESCYEFSPSLTPQVSYLETILAHWQAPVDKYGNILPKEILTFDHTGTNMEFLVEPEKIIEFARSQDVDIMIQNSGANRGKEFICCTIRDGGNKCTSRRANVWVAIDNEMGNKGNTVKKKSSKEASHPPTKGRTRKLHMPFSKYWVYEVHQSQPESYFESDIEPDFPDSFSWLLTECSKILEMKTFDVYTQIRLVEQLCFREVDLAALNVACPSRSLREK